MQLKLIEQYFYAGRDEVESKKIAVVFLLHWFELAGVGGNVLLAFLTHKGNSVEKANIFVDGASGRI